MRETDETFIGKCYQLVVIQIQMTMIKKETTKKNNWNIALESEKTPEGISFISFFWRNKKVFEETKKKTFKTGCLMMWGLRKCQVEEIPEVGRRGEERSNKKENCVASVLYM